jgi:hypothetical protein
LCKCELRHSKETRTIADHISKPNITSINVQTKTHTKGKQQYENQPSKTAEFRLQSKTSTHDAHTCCRSVLTTLRSASNSFCALVSSAAAAADGAPVTAPLPVPVAEAEPVAADETDASRLAVAELRSSRTFDAFSADADDTDADADDEESDTDDDDEAAAAFARNV